MSPSRLQQMLLSLALAGSCAAVPLAGPPGYDANYGTSRFNATTALKTCLDYHQVPYYVETDPNWTEYATTFNSRLQYEPAAIALPTSAQHISNSVGCAAKARVPVQPKSGGHSYASYSTGGRDGILMIDLENFNAVTLDKVTGIAVVGGGVRLGNLALAIYNNRNLRALAHGTCPGVGIGGHFTHGGYGYSSRAFGLAMDQIVGLDVVLANGTYVHANDTSYPEVYYALRGAADAFGVVVNFYLQTSPAPPDVVNWSFSFPQALASAEAGVLAFKGVQNFALNGSVVDGKLGFGVTIGGNGASFSVHGTYFGPVATFNATVAPALLAQLPWPPASDSSVQAVDWITSLTLLGGAPTLEVPLHGVTDRDNFFAKSVTTTEPFSDEAIRKFFQYILDNGVGSKAPVDWFSIINLYGGPGSAITRKNETFAAYSGHDDLWVIQNYGNVAVNGSFPSAGLDFINGLNDAVTSEVLGFGAYLNYVDPTYNSTQAHNLYYGTELYERLSTLKHIIDPLNLFSNPQSIW
ncbi:hypothetical protein B0T26DRAFT_755358 [Lasiosphaeria miniovina]|uniref:FAD-binding PCMH-type domain-containing protein n=1 Tax=Lasiosphaeria miniovina TaxID=1954250 RepID=A0AA40A6L7_9PEZI|nr:uncharacterized protein B0T26DRAFT_755358 [Lasiosphaeria miniovina]KAK0710273.1 hypothetical protein B0T26DRAFT_755358 [Lasiosphaeria miniovina]